MGIEGRSEHSLTAALTLTAAVFSGFMNTIAAAAVVLPVAMSVYRRAQIPPSRLLMPLAFGALLGGTATLLTTSNTVVSTALAQAGFRAYVVLDFLPLGLPLVFAGTGLMLWLGPRLLPRRDLAGQIARTRRLQTELAQVYHLREGLSQLLGMTVLYPTRSATVLFYNTFSVLSRTSIMTLFRPHLFSLQSAHFS